jgi:hypothetical protein
LRVPGHEQGQEAAQLLVGRAEVGAHVSGGSQRLRAGVIRRGGQSAERTEDLLRRTRGGSAGRCACRRATMQRRAVQCV